MITPNTYATKLPFRVRLRDSHPGLSSVLAAAVVNRDFREMLLSDPRKALQQGYLGKTFALSQEETSLIVSIQAVSLTDLARQIILTQGNGD